MGKTRWEFPNEIRLVLEVLEEHRAADVTVLDLRELSDATDYFIIATGSSDTHVRALTERLAETLKKMGAQLHHIEGLQAGRWVLLDFVDFVIHVFHPTLREFYQLERLWSDAPSLVSSGGV